MYTRILQVCMTIITALIIITGVIIGLIAISEGAGAGGGLIGLIYIAISLLLAAWIGAQVEMMVNIMEIREMLESKNFRNEISKGKEIHTFSYEDVRRRNGEEPSALDRSRSTEEKVVTNGPWVCKKCNERNSADAIFCQNCGNKK